MKNSYLKKLAFWAVSAFLLFGLPFCTSENEVKVTEAPCSVSLRQKAWQTKSAGTTCNTTAGPGYSVRVKFPINIGYCINLSNKNLFKHKFTFFEEDGTKTQEIPYNDETPDLNLTLDSIESNVCITFGSSEYVVCEVYFESHDGKVKSETQSFRVDK